MNNKELWLKGCETNKTLIYKLEENNNIELYKLCNKYEFKGNYFYTNPVYMIWKDNKNIWTSLNLFDSYKLYNKLTKEFKNEM